MGQNNFDPFNDRISRDIRNSLSTAFIEDLIQGRMLAVNETAQRWLRQVTEAFYRDHIRRCVSKYERVIAQSRSFSFPDLRYCTHLVWNAGLFFELHELLESFWKSARGTRRTALKGLIQAAGAYVHRERGNFNAAQGLALRARKTLVSVDPGHFDFVGGIESLVDHLSDMRSPAPRLQGIRRHLGRA